jgi:hypothetical protein
MSVVMNWDRNSAKMKSQRSQMKTGIHEEASHGMSGGRLSIDGRDKHPLVTAGTHAILPSRGKEVSKS